MDNPFDQIFRRPHLYQCRPPSTWKYWQFVFHYIPAYLVDFICTIIRKKPRSHSHSKHLIIVPSLIPMPNFSYLYMVSFPYQTCHTFYRMVVMYKKIEKALDQLDYFTQRSWKVNDDDVNIMSLIYY